MNSRRVKTFREKFHIPGKLALSLNKLLGRENINDDDLKTNDGDNKSERFSRFSRFTSLFVNSFRISSNPKYSLTKIALA